jgi:hypothetical protein
VQNYWIMFFHQDAFMKTLSGDGLILSILNSSLVLKLDQIEINFSELLNLFFQAMKLLTFHLHVSRPQGWRRVRGFNHLTYAQFPLEIVKQQCW